MSNVLLSEINETERLKSKINIKKNDNIFLLFENKFFLFLETSIIKKRTAEMNAALLLNIKSGKNNPDKLTK